MFDGSTSVSRRLLAALERGLPAALLAEGEPRRRALLIAGTAWVAALACLLTIPVIAGTMDGTQRALSIAVTAAVPPLSLVGVALLRRTGSPTLAGHWMTAIVFAGIAYAMATNGGLSSQYTVLLPAVPLLATQMAGRRAGWQWSFLCAAQVTALLALERAGVALPRFTPPADQATVLAVFTVMTVLAVHALSSLAEVAKDDAIARAEATTSRLERADLEVERATVLAEQAVAASAAKSAFMTTMSHELRTPLNAVIGYAELLIEEADERRPPDMRDDLGKIVGSSRHLLKLIDDILDLSRVEAARLDLRPETFFAQELVREVTEALEPLARKRFNALEDRSQERPFAVHVDRARARQVLINLVGNAIKFTWRGRVVARAREETGEAGQRWLVLEVEDTGIGIADADQIKIFESFTQVDSSTSRRYEGSGLGLSLCRKLVELMGGTIAVRSRPGIGSTFTARLPAGAPAP